MNLVLLIKFIGSWGCIIAACVLLFLGHQVFEPLAGIALVAIAFAQAPTTWA